MDPGDSSRTRALACLLLLRILMSRHRHLILPVSMLFLAAAGRADELADDGADAGADAGQVRVTWRAAPGETRASGSSRSAEWSRLSLAGGDSQVRFRIPVASFSSGDPAQDAKARALLEAGRHPYLELDGVVHGLRFEGTITLRGVARRLAMGLELLQQGQHLTTRAAFKVDLREFGLAADSECTEMEFELFARLPANRQVAISGGAIALR